jgi:hypothetical protein
MSESQSKHKQIATERLNPDAFYPFTIILKGEYVDPDGKRNKITKSDLRDHIQTAMNRISPTDAQTAGRVAVALVKLVQIAPEEPGDSAMVRHTDASGTFPKRPKRLPHKLTEREQKVLELRSENEDGKKQTLKEVGSEFGITPGRVRQIEGKAAAKLRSNELATSPSRYDAVTFLRYPEEEMAQRLGEKTAQDLGRFLLAETSPNIALNPQALETQLEFPLDELRNQSLNLHR